ncbi:MAG: class I SAM-dependent methyltransferase [Pseudomonadota bacterium]
MTAFFELHRDLPREGPGDRASLDWAMAIARPPPDARILDAGCGPGADIAGLLAHAPAGQVHAVDLHAPFVAAVARASADDPRVTAEVADMASLPGPYDLIWCAGALYFLGVEAGLRSFTKMLTTGGHVVFSEAVWRTNNPSPGAQAAWADYPAMQDAAGVAAAIARAGFRLRDSTLLSDAAWEAYFGPVERRIADLRAGEVGAHLAAVLADAEAEISAWRAHGDEYGYALFVVTPE